MINTFRKWLVALIVGRGRMITHRERLTQRHERELMQKEIARLKQEVSNLNRQLREPERGYFGALGGPYLPRKRGGR